MFNDCYRLPVNHNSLLFMLLFNLLESSGAPACLEDEFSCVYQTTYLTCLERHRRCDYVVDCDDSSDETDCGK